MALQNDSKVNRYDIYSDDPNWWYSQFKFSLYTVEESYLSEKRYFRTK